MQIAKLSDQWQTQINNSIALNFASQVGKKPSDLLISKNLTTDLSRQLWQARIANPKDGKTSKGENKLRQIIRQINSVEFKPQDQTSEPLIVVEPIHKTEPDETSSDSDVPQEAEPKSSFSSKQQDEKQLLHRQITNQTLQIFEQLSQQPQQLKKPLELAEILFRNSSLKESAKCYQEALNRMAANEDNRHKERAWILFQIGNCLRNTDRPTATERYKKLINEYPDSPWADLAKARIKLLDWYQQDKPRELVAENRF
ncbi:MAG: tetratricopeptide repeat protein [Planctomycetota bacterium]